LTVCFFVLRSSTVCPIFDWFYFQTHTRHTHPPTHTHTQEGAPNRHHLLMATTRGALVTITPIGPETHAMLGLLSAAMQSRVVHALGIAPGSAVTSSACVRHSATVPLFLFFLSTIYHMLLFQFYAFSLFERRANLVPHSSADDHHPFIFVFFISLSLPPYLFFFFLPGPKALPATACVCGAAGCLPWPTPRAHPRRPPAAP
jgi:hypothetical protein